MKKYNVYRKSEYTGRVEILLTKCSDTWCDEKYFKEHPERVWKFSRSGAKKIVDRNASRGWAFTFWMEEAV